MALSASPSVLQTMTPFPAASPEAFTTTGAPKRRAAAFASATSVCISARAVGMPSSSMSCLANAFDVSISAAARVGPKIGQAGRAEPVDDPRLERRFRADDA